MLRTRSPRVPRWLGTIGAELFLFVRDNFITHMDTTVFLAQMWGPAMLAVGLGFFVSRKYYVKIYRDLEKETFALLIFGMAGIAAGIAQVSIHNVWDTVPQVIVSLLGWALIVKAAVFAIAPNIVDQWGDWAADSKLIPVAGAFVLIIGAYLSWFAYLA